MRVFALWHGGPNYVQGDQSDDLETFPSIAAASDALQAREDSGHWQAQRFEYVNKPASSDLCPCVQDSSLTLYSSPDPDCEPFAILERGPRGGVRRTNL